MSFTALQLLERCPLQWALTNGSYPQIWTDKGYPTKPSVAMLQGQVVHSAIAVVLRCLAHAGCQSSTDRCAAEALRKQGGLALIVEDCVDSAIRQACGNPRLEFSLTALENRVRGNAGSLRERVQLLLSQVDLPRGIRTANSRRGGTLHPRSRRPLTQGAHSDVVLLAPDLAWKGIADLIAIDGTRCAIAEFKTGKRQENHELQILLYSLLWFHDRVLNPAGEPARKLTLLYADGAVNVTPPDPGELASLATELLARSRRVLGSIQPQPPSSRLEPDSCRLCGVRQLCESYWDSLEQDGTVSPSDEVHGRRYVDAEVRILGNAGPTSWFAEASNSQDLLRGARLLLECTDRRMALEPKDVVRVLNGELRIHTHQDAVASILVIGVFTELFKVDSRSHTRSKMAPHRPAS